MAEVKNEPKKQIINRLNRIGGQVRGLALMFEEDKPCCDALVQLGAIRAALGKVGLLIIAQLMEECCSKAELRRKREIIDESVVTFIKYADYLK